MSFPGYPKYKQSGVEWLGEVPNHWRVARLRRAARLLTDKSDEAVNPIALENLESWTGRFIATDTEFETDGVALESGDVLFGKLRPYLAKVYVATANGTAVGDFHVLRPMPCLTSRFLQYVMLSREFIEIVNGSTFGSKMPRASWEFMGDLEIPVPSMGEQEALVRFLDAEVEKLDALVSEQRRLMQLLTEKRHAVISHAVTKGLDPSAPTMPTGVDELGAVPKHWDVKPLRAIANVVRGASPRPAGDLRYFNGDAVPWVTVAEITRDDAMEIVRTDTFLTLDGADRSRLFPSGTLLYSNSGVTLGVPKILRVDACANDGVVGLLDLDPRVDIEFLYHCLASNTLRMREKVKQGSGQPNLNTDIVKGIRFACPPLGEQRTIVRYVSTQLARFASLSDHAARAIALLQERRAALISAAVTGKIDVRQLADAEAA